MNRAQKITLGASALTVAGVAVLAALAVHTVAALAPVAHHDASAVPPAAEKAAVVAEPAATGDAAAAAEPGAVPVAATEYRDRFYQGIGNGYAVDLTLDEVRDLYFETTAGFPYPLPEGVSFPTDPGYYDDPALGLNWSKSQAVMRVFDFWAYSNATAAKNAFAAGDDAAFQHYVDVLHAGFVGVLPPSYEPQNGEYYFDLATQGWSRGSFASVTSGNWFYNPFPYKAR